MNKIICYSAMHTGTWFLIRLLETSTSQWTDAAGDANLSSRGRPYKMEESPEGPINDQWYTDNVEQYLTGIEKNKDLIIIHGHHFSLISKMPSSISNNEVTIPIVIPLRDPLKAIVSLCWRRYKKYEDFIQNSSEEERIGRADVHLERIKQLLKLPSDKVHLFPVDLYNESGNKNTQHEQQAKDLFKFCKLNPTDRTEKYIANWQPTNTTKSWVLPGKGLITPPRDKTFIKINKMLDNRNTAVRNLIEIEYDRAHSDKELIELLQQIGYKEMTWW